MNIGFFTDTYLPNIDGVVTSILNYRGELEKRGHKVFIFSSGDSQAIKNNKDPRVFYYQSIKFPPYPQYKIALFPFNAKKICRENEIELVHCHAIASMGLSAIKTAEDMKIPLVGTFHTMLPSAFKLVSKKKWVNDLASAVAWEAIKNFYKPFDLVTAPTKTVCNVMREHGIDSTVLPNAVDTQRFQPGLDKQVIRKIFSIGKDEKVILTTGRVSPEKNLEVIVEAAELLLKQTKARFIISGDGPAKAAVEKLVEDKGLKENFVFTGFVKATELPFMYAACDCFVTASTFETQGLALLEAMACGKPVVGADAMAIPEAVEEGKDGFLFQPFDALECSQKIMRVLEMKNSDYDKMGDAARKTAEKFSVEKSTDRLLEVYKKALK